MTKIFFSHSPHSPPHSPLQFHETLEEAEQAAQADLDAACGDDGWDANVTEIRYGTVIGQVHESERMPWAEHLKVHLGEEVEEGESPPYDEWVDYRLVDHSIDLLTVIGEINANLGRFDYEKEAPDRNGCIVQLQCIKVMLGKFKAPTTPS